MGVDITTYLFYGIKLNRKDFNEDVYQLLLPEIEGQKGVTFDVIWDTMGGDYIIIGKRIAEANRYDDSFKELTASNLPDVEKLVKDINDRLGTSYLKKDFKLLFFNHFW